MGAGLGVHDQPRAAGVDVLLGHHVGCVDHQVGLERHRGVRACGGDHVGTEREVRHELAVHHVPLDEVDAGRFECGDLLAELGEVGRKHRRRDLDGPASSTRQPTRRAAHRPRRRRSSSSSSVVVVPLVVARSTLAFQFSASARDGYGPSMWSPGPRSAAGTATLRLRSKYHCSLLMRPLCHLVTPTVRPAPPYAGPMQLTVRTDRLVAGGDAMGRADDGRVVFVTGALPGELVEVDVVETKKDFSRGRVHEILEAVRRSGAAGVSAPPRRLRRVRLDASRARRAARGQGRHRPRIAASGRPARRVHRRRRSSRSAAAVDPFGYRTTIRVVGGPNGTLGYREERSDQVVPINSCPIAESSLSRLLRQIEVDEGAEVTLRTSVATGAITAIWSKEHHKGDPRPAEHGAHRRAGLADRTDRRPRPAGVGGFVLPVGCAGRGAARRRGRHGRRRNWRPLDTRSTPTAASDCSPSRRWPASATSRSSSRPSRPASTPSTTSPIATGAGRARRSSSRRSGRWRAPADRPIDVVVADPARSGLGKPGVAALTAGTPPRARARELRSGVAGPRRDADGGATATDPSPSRCSTSSRTRRTSRPSPASSRPDDLVLARGLAHFERAHSDLFRRGRRRPGRWGAGGRARVDHLLPPRPAVAVQP